MLEALNPVKIEVDQVVLLECLNNRFQTLSAYLSFLVVILIEFQDERDVKFTIIHRLHDQRATVHGSFALESRADAFVSDRDIVVL